MKTRNYKDLVVWQKEINLAKKRLSIHAKSLCNSSDASAAFELLNEPRRMLNALRRKLATRA